MAEPNQTPPCRVCGKVEPVVSYWDHLPQEAVCPECCDTADHPDGEHGHQWQYNPWERGRECMYCGILKRCTKYAYEG